MLLEGKTAIVYGGGGSIGGAVARGFAREGAGVYLAGRTREKLDAVADEIRARGGRAETAAVDALDGAAVERHAAAVAEAAGAIDISFNAVGMGSPPTPPLIELSFEQYVEPIMIAVRSHFLIARAVAPRMVEQGSGVIFAYGGSGTYPIPNFGGFGPAFDAIEGFRRHLAVELGPQGVRVVTLRTAGSPESILEAERDPSPPGMTREEMVAAMEEGTMLKRLPSLEDVGNVAAFVASDRARSMTATAVNISCGAQVD